MRSRRTLALLQAATLATLAAWAGPAGVAWAQDDWSLTREPTAPVRARAAPSSSPQVVRDRQRRAALADPTDPLAFEQLRAGELARTGALSELSDWLHAEASGARAESAQLLLARVMASLGQGEQALQLLVGVRAASAHPEHATRLRASLLAELGRSAEAATELESLAATERRPDERAALWRAAARERLRANDPEAAVHALREARKAGARAGLVAQEEQRALERDAFRRSGKLAELATSLAEQGEWARAAGLWEELGELDQALLAHRRALARAPSDLASRASVARLLAQRGEYDEAERQARELVRRAPGKLEHVLQLAELLRAAGRRQDALAVLATFSRERPTDPSAHRALRELYQQWDEPALAEQELRRMASLTPRAPEPRVARAEQALARGQRAAAVALLEGVRTGPRSAAEEAALSALLAERDLLPEALAHAERAVALAPRDLSYRRAHASLLERSGRLVDAERAFALLLEDPAVDRGVRREARQHLVSAWSRAGTLALHVAELRAKESTAGLDGPETLLLAELYARDSRQVPAQVALLERWLAQAPHDVDAWLALAKARRQLGDARGLLAAWTALLATGGAEAVVYAREAVQAAIESAHELVAEDLVERARKLAPGEPAVQRLVGDFYAARADRARARVAYERVLELDSHDAAARLALASEAFANADPVRARELLEPLLTQADDEAASNDAGRLLLRRDAEHAERVLLELSRPGAGTRVLRQLLFEHWAATLLPLAARTEQGTASAQEREQVHRRVSSCLGILLAALASGAPQEREVALGLLDAVSPPAALGPVLALAEASERALHERARALRIVGKLRATAAAPRLSVLYASAPRALRPFVVWALVESGATAGPAALRAELAARSRDQRALAAVLSIDLTVSATSEILQRLREDDPDAAVRAAAGWALSRGARPSSDPAALDASGNEGLLSLASRADRAEVAEGLFVADADVRELAAAYVRGVRRPLERAPAPRWPFVLDDYLREVAGGRAGPGVVGELSSERRSAIARALSARLAAGGPMVEPTLRALVPAAGGVVPSALLRGGCAPSGLATLLFEASEDRLAALLTGADAALSALALAPLVLGGGADRDEVRSVLERGSDDTRRELLRALAGLPALPTGLRAAIERLAHDSPDWPTRLWATRALHPKQGPIEGEPMALVRAAAHTAWGSLAAPPACEPTRPATN